MNTATPIPIGEGDLSQGPLVIEMRESKSNDTTALKLSETNGALGLLHRFTFLRKADEKLEFGLSPGTWKLRVKMRDKTQNLVTEYVELMVTIGDGATKWPSRDEWPKLSDIQ